MNKEYSFCPNCFAKQLQEYTKYWEKRKTAFSEMAEVDYLRFIEKPVNYPNIDDEKKYTLCQQSEIFIDVMTGMLKVRYTAKCTVCKFTFQRKEDIELGEVSKKIMDAIKESGQQPKRGD